MRRNVQVGGYRFEPAGDKQGGVWTPKMRAAEAARVKAVQKAAADAALQEMQTAIDAIMSDDTLSAQQKRMRLGTLRASGYSEREFVVLWQAREEAAAL